MKTNHIIFFIIFIIFFQIICIAQENPTISKAEKPMPHLSGLYSSEGSFSMLDLSSKNHPTLPENFPYPDKKYVEQVEKRTLKTMSFVNDKGEIVIYTSSKNI